MEEGIKQSRGLKILDIVIVFVITLVVNAIGSVIVSFAYTFAYAARGGDLSNYESLINAISMEPSVLLSSSIYNLIAIAVVFIFWRFVDKQEIGRLGFAFRKGVWKELGAGILAAIAAIALIIFFGQGLRIIAFDSMGTRYFSNPQILRIMLISLFTFLLVGFGEEAVYRSYIQNHLTDIAGRRYGLLIAALIFMGAHVFTYGKVLDFIDVFLAGVLLGYMFHLTKSIYLPAAFHFMWDYLQVAVFRIQDYDYYKGPVLVVFRNVGDLVISNFNLGNQLELVFILVELMLLALLHTQRGRVIKLLSR